MVTMAMAVARALLGPSVFDRILAVNGVNISHMCHTDVVDLIKESGRAITLIIAPSLHQSKLFCLFCNFFVMMILFNLEDDQSFKNQQTFSEYHRKENFIDTSRKMRKTGFSETYAGRTIYDRFAITSPFSLV